MKAVIFDRDGIIIDSESINIDSATRAFKEFGIDLKEEDKKFIIGRHPDDYKRFFQERYDFPYEKFREIQKKTYYELLEFVPLFDKTISLIKKLHQMKIPLALTTSSGLKTTLMILERAELEKIFDVIVTSDDYKKRKPNPEPYVITAKKLNINPDECIVIEDSSVGLEAAKQAEMKCIVIPNEYTKKQDFKKADLIVDSADDISIELLQNL